MTMTTTEKIEELKLSADQSVAFTAICQFVWDKKSLLLTMGGYAGTGKSTVIAKVVTELRKKNPNIRIGFMCFTGKAASVLMKKIIDAGCYNPNMDYCGTIHGAIYEPRSEEGVVIEWVKRSELPFDVIFLDEASMVGGELFDDLKSFGLPIVAVGDHGQLPPVGDAFSLMVNPMIRLEQIHRQAENNPIIKLSMMARLEGSIPVGEYGPSVEKIIGPKNLKRFKLDWIKKSMILCGINVTRTRMNREVRSLLGIEDGKPRVGDRVICLRNNKREGIYNGMSGVINDIQEAGEHHYKVIVSMDGSKAPFAGRVFKHQFDATYPIREWEGVNQKAIGNLFDFGYCITVHKAQGSESESVILFEEQFQSQSDEDFARWLYTGVTRARENLMIVGRK